MNSLFFNTRLSIDNLATRERRFAGNVFLKPADTTSTALVEGVIGLMQERLEMKDIRTAHLKWSAEEMFDRIGALRRTVYLDAEFHGRVRAVVTECGFAPDRMAFDPMRLRVVQPGRHLNLLAAPVYYAHRDTWYAHSQSMIVRWVPLHDLDPEETFVFYPNHFDQPIVNNAEIFNYAEWIKDGPALKIGWQKRDSDGTASYPGSLKKTMPPRAEVFFCRAGEHLIFSGAHYHKTLPRNLERTRYSMDFGVVHLDDVAAGRGAPNADNRSRGSTLKDYVQP